MLSQSEEGLKILEAPAIGEWFSPSLWFYFALWPLTLLCSCSELETRKGLLKNTLQRSEDACRATESELASAGELMARNDQALVDSLERNRVLEEELSQL
jgi:hypothetical protein